MLGNKPKLNLAGSASDPILKHAIKVKFTTGILTEYNGSRV